MEVTFLEYKATKIDFAISPSEFEAMQAWSVTTYLTQCRGFLGLANYCRKLVPGFS